MRIASIPSQEGRTLPHRPAVFVSALTVLGLAATPAAAQAPASQTITFKETNKGSTFAFVDNPPRAKNPRRPTFSPGDNFIISNPLVSSSGARVGVLRATCTITQASKNPAHAPTICYGVFSLKAGQLDALVSTTSLEQGVSGAIIGGTGAYAGARGTFKSVTTKTGDNDTITLLG
jgi:hypothetical protein